MTNPAEIAITILERRRQLADIFGESEAARRIKLYRELMEPLSREWKLPMLETAIRFVKEHRDEMGNIEMNVILCAGAGAK